MNKRKKTTSPLERKSTQISNFFKPKQSSQENKENEVNKKSPSKNALAITTCEKCSTSVREYELAHHSAFDCPPKSKRTKIKQEIPQYDDNDEPSNSQDSSPLQSPVKLEIPKIVWQKEVPGLGIFNDFITKEEAEYLFQELRKYPWEPAAEFSGKRYFQQYGPVVDFFKNKVLDEFNAFPDYSNKVLQWIKERVEELRDFEPNHQQNNHYLKSDGHEIYFHADNRKVFGDVIVCLSLLGDCNFVMQNIKDPNIKLAFPVPKNSLLVMTKESRYEWKHGIPNEQLLSPIRISVTFRAVKHDLNPNKT